MSDSELSSALRKSDSEARRQGLMYGRGTLLMHAATLSPMVTLSQGPGENILSLLSTSGVLMAAAGRKLVVWRSMGGMEHTEFVSHRPRHYQQMALFGLEEISRLGVAQ